MLPDGRGYRPLRRLLRGDQGPHRGVRRGADPRHAAVRERLCRRRDRRGLGRDAADRRDHDGQFQPPGARPDRQQRRDDPAYVGRPVRGAAGDPHGDRRRTAGRGAAFAQPRRLVRPYSGPARPGAGGAGRRALHAGGGARRPQPGADLRACHALQHRGRARSGGDRGRYRACQAPPRAAATSASSPTATASSRRSPPPICSAAEGIAAEVIDLRVLRPLDTATILASVAKTRRVVIVDEGWKSGSLVGRDRHAHRRGRLSSTSTRRCAGCAAAKCRCPTRRISKTRRCRSRPTSPRRRAVSCAANERFPDAGARRRHGSGHVGRMADQARRPRQARRRHCRRRNAERRDRGRDFRRGRGFGPGADRHQGAGRRPPRAYRRRRPAPGRPPARPAPDADARAAPAGHFPAAAARIAAASRARPAPPAARSPRRRGGGPPSWRSIRWGSPAPASTAR